MSQIINLSLTKDTSVENVQEFYNKLTRSYDAFETLGESEMLKRFVLQLSANYLILNLILFAQMIHGRSGA